MFSTLGIVVLVALVTAKDLLDVVELHGIECKWKGGCTARSKGEEWIIFLQKIVTLVKRCCFVGMPKMKNVSMAALVNHAVGKLNRQRNAFDVGCGNEKIELLYEGRWFLLGRNFIGRRFLIHFGECLQQL